MIEANNISILQNCKCRDCGWPIIDMCCNDQDMQFAEWDWWQYCSNKSCSNHFGEGVFQNTPHFVETMEEPCEYGYQLLDTRFIGLVKTEKTIENGVVDVDWGDGKKRTAISMSSQCPYCGDMVEWRTTGLLPNGVRCEKCEVGFGI